MDQAKPTPEHEKFPLESPGKLTVTFLWHAGQQHMLLRLLGDDRGIVISPDELREIIVLCRDRLLPVKSPRFTAITDQVMAEIRDNEQELMRYAMSESVVPGKITTIIKACVLIALKQLDRVDF